MRYAVITAIRPREAWVGFPSGSPITEGKPLGDSALGDYRVGRLLQLQDACQLLNECRRFGASSVPWASVGFPAWPAFFPLPSGPLLGPLANLAKVDLTGSAASSTCICVCTCFFMTGLSERFTFLLVLTKTSSSCRSSSGSEASALKGSTGDASLELSELLSAGGGVEPDELGCLSRVGELSGVGLMSGVSGEIGTGGEAMRTVLTFGEARAGAAAVVGRMSI